MVKEIEANGAVPGNELVVGTFSFETVEKGTDVYLDPSRGAKSMVQGAIKQPLRVQTPPLGGCC